MRLPHLHREVLDPHLQRGHPVHSLHKVSPQGPAWASEHPLHLSEEFKGVFQLGCSSQTLPSRGRAFWESQGWVGACRPRCSGAPWGHIILPGRLGLSKCLPCSSTLRARRKAQKCLWLPARLLPRGEGSPAGWPPQHGSSCTNRSKQPLLTQPWPFPSQQGGGGRVPLHPTPLTVLSAPQERELLLRHRVVRQTHHPESRQRQVRDSKEERAAGSLHGDSG